MGFSIYLRRSRDIDGFNFKKDQKKISVPFFLFYKIMKIDKEQGGEEMKWGSKVINGV